MLEIGLYGAGLARIALDNHYGQLLQLFAESHLERSYGTMVITMARLSVTAWRPEMP